VLALLLLPLAATGSEKAPVDGPVFVRLQPFTLPVFEGNTVTRQATVVVALELEQGKTEADVDRLRPKLVDAFLGELREIYEKRRHEPRVIDAGIIKPRLKEAADRILGPGIVDDVLIQQAFERRW
jgi:hypothetical protein